MSVSSRSAAVEREEREDIVGVGNRAKSLVQLSFNMSSMTKPGSMVGEYSVGLRGGDQKIEIAAWSDPRESSKETDTGEKRPVHKAASFRRNKSRMESRLVLFSERVPFLVATPVGLASERSDFSNHSSRGVAQLDTIAPGKDQVEECVLKSLTTSVGKKGSRGYGKMWDRAGVWLHTEW